MRINKQDKEYNLTIDSVEYKQIINSISSYILKTSKILLNLYEEIQCWSKCDQYYYEIERGIDTHERHLKQDTELLLSLLKNKRKYYNPFGFDDIRKLNKVEINKDLIKYLSKGGER